MCVSLTLLSSLSYSQLEVLVNPYWFANFELDFFHMQFCQIITK